MAEVPTGIRFACTVCGAEFIVTNGGDADITCDGQPVVKK
jgi:ribosomal protein S27E